MKKTEIRPEILDELLGEAKTQEAIFGPDGLIKTLTGALVQRVLNAEMDVHLEQQQAQGFGNRRNGHSTKNLQTDAGTIPIEVPRDRQARFEPLLVPKHQRRLGCLNDKILALYSAGMSTRQIQDHLMQLYNVPISPELVSRVTDVVVEELTQWRQRPLDSVYAVLWIDALFIKVRDQGAVQNKAVYVVLGLDLQGRRNVLGLWMENNEGAKCWTRILSELQQRGVRDVFIVCCDGLKGFSQAIAAVFSKSIIQTCLVHQVRHSLSMVPRKDYKGIVEGLRSIYQAVSEEAAKEALMAFEAKWGASYAVIVKSWKANWELIRPCFSFPHQLRRIIYTTNPIESFNAQLRRLTANKGHFPTEESLFKLLYLAVRNAERKWTQQIASWREIFLQINIFFGDRMPSGNG